MGQAINPGLSNLPGSYLMNNVEPRVSGHTIIYNMCALKITTIDFIFSGRARIGL